MFIAYIVSGILMAALAAFSAVGKLRHDPRQVKTIHEAIGVPIQGLTLLATCEIAGAVELLVGIAWAPLGLAAAIGLVIYFIGAIVAHVRIRDYKGIGTPVKFSVQRFFGWAVPRCTGWGRRRKALMRPNLHRKWRRLRSADREQWEWWSII